MLGFFRLFFSSIKQIIIQEDGSLISVSVYKRKVFRARYNHYPGTKIHRHLQNLQIKCLNQAARPVIMKLLAFLVCMSICAMLVVEANDYAEFADCMSGSACHLTSDRYITHNGTSQNRALRVQMYLSFGTTRTRLLHLMI
ncbi:hypothetical protein RRG08_000424 [Elysia crispata]|uniref:Uncharacterized protein n=1 Tax=Elysia crispata TaxID=231223 RepID=A0AAE0ZSZ1_9GAST|nr:hypothetical protein RRG08_000424 [Elysia crispata]